MNFDTLLEPVRFGSLELPNRMFVAAMVTQYAGEDNLPTERWNCYYERKARGGWGIVFTENYGVCPGALLSSTRQGCGTTRRFPRTEPSWSGFTVQVGSSAARSTMPVARRTRR